MNLQGTSVIKVSVEQFFTHILEVIRFLYMYLFFGITTFSKSSEKIENKSGIEL